MTDRTSGTHRTTSSMEDTLRWVNVSGESIPAYGVVQLRSNYASGYSQASKPNDTSGLFFANGAVAVASTKKGESLLWSRPQLVKVTGSPAVGTQVGPVSGSWAMSETGTGFYIVHQPVDGVAAVVQAGGGGGGTHEIWFRIVSVECVSPTETILTVEPTWYTGGCDTDIPGQDPYTGYITVEDVCSILRFYTAEWLGSGDVVGRATYMYPRSGYCTATWLVDTICGIPDCA